MGWSSSSSALGATKNAAPPLKEVFKDRPTRSGRLQEVDLGEEVRDRNAALTEQARRRLAGEASDDESAEGKPRLGKDGKPWRSRKRRASDDIKRDQLVEELMRENKREFYLFISFLGISFLHWNNPPPPPSTPPMFSTRLFFYIC